MNFFKKWIALILVSVLTVCCSFAGFAPAAYASIYSPDSEYDQINYRHYEYWSGDREFEDYTNYYIDDTVKISKDQTFTLPAGSRLLLCEDSQLLMYVGSSLKIEGELIIEPGAVFKTSGTVNLAADGWISNYGTVVATVSSMFKISSNYMSMPGSESVFGGKVYIYKSGILSNYSDTTFASDSEVKITGQLVTGENHNVFIQGDFAVTISGTVTQKGNVYLYSEILNSGYFDFQPGSRYYKTEDAMFWITQSGTIIDDRHKNVEPPDSGNDGDDDYSVEWFGVDVSRWQNVIDWDEVSDAGVDFAFVRASIGNGWDDPVKYGEDRLFAYNVEHAQAAGIYVGAYHYLCAETVEEAREEAQFFIETIEPYKLEFPVALDFEDPSQTGLGKTLLTNMAMAFMDEIIDAGYYPMIYTNVHWMNNNFDSRQLVDYDVWIAHWGVDEPAYDGDYGVWQYSSKGDVSGIDGDVDLNICYKNYYKIISEGGYNHLND